MPFFFTLYRFVFVYVLGRSREILAFKLFFDFAHSGEIEDQNGNNGKYPANRPHEVQEGKIRPQRENTIDPNKTQKAHIN